ncbi:MAG: hypothetical protein ABI867_11955 [Kofleriaceae bacterium]
MTRIICLLAFAACSVSEAKVPNEVTVELASVTLAENCTATTPPPPPSTFAKPPPAVAARGSSPARRRCEQTSMQLAITAQPGVKPTTIKIKRVELLDKEGKVLETLTASSPMKWTDKGVYAAWDQGISADAAVKASYALTAPNWNKYGGRMTAHTKTFQLRVTVTIGSSDRTVEKTSITPVRIEPMVVT